MDNLRDVFFGILFLDILSQLEHLIVEHHLHLILALTPLEFMVIFKNAVEELSEIVAVADRRYFKELIEEV